MTLKKTPLNEVHRRAGGRMVAFAGWEMPVQYEGVVAEHLAVRNTVGVFDVSHMGELEVTGADALSMIQKVTCNDASRLSDFQAQYTAFLYPQGTFVDDVVLYRFHARHFLLCVNAANREKDLRWLQDQLEGQVTVEDRSDDYVQLAIQGPRSGKVLQKLTDFDLNTLRFYRFQRGKVNGCPALVSRTGYTGEDGFEIYFSPDHAEEMWERLFQEGNGEGIKAAGLAARNTLRLEMCYPLYGNDIDETTTPLEAGLGWIVKPEKGDFIGRAALAKQKLEGATRKLCGFEMVDRGIARDHQPVFFGGKQCGKVTSGSYSPSLQKSIGLAYLPLEAAAVGTEIEVEIHSVRRRARLVATPFYKRK